MTYGLAQMWENGAEGGKFFFFTPCVYTQDAQILWRIQMWVNNTKKILTP